MKRKWSLRDESMDMEEELPLCLWLRSSSSSDSKASSATMSSPNGTDEAESSMDLELDFSLHICGKKVSSSNKPSLDLQNQVDHELTLSSTPTSSVTSLSGITHHNQKQGHGGACTKSVHGGTPHGGGKRCVVKDCTRSARGRTECCVRDVGGKRCKYEGCGKSGEGSSDFCKVHGGWVEDKRVHGGATLGPHDPHPPSVVMTEGRVHGGSLIAFLTAANLDSEKVNMI